MTLKGGKSDGMTLEDIAKKHGKPVEALQEQLEKGIEHEKEHTDDPKIAEKIALDHLVEDCEYYDHLEEMEKEAKEGEAEVEAPEGGAGPASAPMRAGMASRMARV